MTDQRDKADIGPAATVADEAAPAAAAGISRRALLRGASAAAPAILTLNSNAAFGWSLTSGTVGTIQPTGQTGEATCLVDGVEVDPNNKPGVYSTDGASFVKVDGQLMYSSAADGSQLLSPEQVCTRTETIYYSGDNGSTWQPVEAPGGALVSFSALSAASFSGTDVTSWPSNV